ncbi:hypothetical protein [Serratia phage PCH45]|uniref:hypothetical protein n=1 Tax=Serratia phage PCH45 TaxID=2608368 RepID=UPI0012A8694D|nr:hypothetical protein [Serratia phage PCH45]
MAIDYMQGWQGVDPKQVAVGGSASVETWLNNLTTPRGTLKSIRDLTIYSLSNGGLRHNFENGADGQVQLATYATSGYPYTVAARFFVAAQETGISTFGARLKRNGNTSAQCVRIIGALSTSAGNTGSAYIGGTNSLLEVYVEVLINWDAKTFSIYLNDTLQTTMNFTSLTEIYIGSLASYPLYPPGNTSGSTSWAFSASNGKQNISDIYANYDAPGDENPIGRLGPIIIRPIPIVDVSIANGSFSGTSKEEWMANKSVYNTNPNKGIRTAGDGKKTIATFDDVTKYRKEGEEIVGFGITQTFTNFDPVKPTKFVGNVSGPSGTDYSGKLERLSGGSSYSSPLWFTFAVSGMSEEDLKGPRFYMDMLRAAD